MKTSTFLVAVFAATVMATPLRLSGPACHPGDIDCLPNGEYAVKRSDGLEARMNYFGTDFDTRFGFPSKRADELEARMNYFGTNFDTRFGMPSKRRLGDTHMNYFGTDVDTRFGMPARRGISMSGPTNWADIARLGA